MLDFILADCETALKYEINKMANKNDFIIKVIVWFFEVRFRFFERDNNYMTIAAWLNF